MNKIEAEYVPGSDEHRFTGLGDVICPMCGKHVGEADMGTTHDEGGERSMEICDDCLIEADKELGIAIDADVLPAEKFQRLWYYVLPIVQERRASEPDARCAQLVNLLGGSMWQSGGGIWLILIRRGDGHVIAISDECVSEYTSDDALAGGSACNSIRLV
jgi:hypothetical protein